MKTPNQIRHLPFILYVALAAVFVFAHAALAQLTVTPSSQTGSLPFTPTWSPVANHLLLGVTPAVAVGSFNAFGVGSSVNSLTQINPSVTVYAYGSAGQTNYNMGGHGTGTLLQYNLDTNAAPDGYNLTNVSVYGGWQDGGRNGQQYAVLYSTVENPTTFIFLTMVSDNPGGNVATRVVVNDAAGGVIASNVASIQFDFSIGDPSPNDINNGAGYLAITAQGTAASSVVAPAVSITTSNQNSASQFIPTWTPETPDSIAGMLPSSSAGNFNVDGNETVGLTVLTDGSVGNTGDKTTMVSCGGGSGAGSSLVYTLTNSVNGSDVTNIVVYSMWPDTGRDGQYYILSYSTVSAPTTFIPITTIFYRPNGNGGGNAQANRVAIFNSTGGPLAQNMGSLKFDFASPTRASGFNNGWQGYTEIVVQGTNSAPPVAPPSPYLTQDTLPSYAETVVGDQVVFTAAYSNSPPTTLQWVVINNGVTNNVTGANVSGATTAALTLNNVQLTNSGLYSLEGINATNSGGVSFSTPRQLVVNTNPAAVNGIVVNYAGQTFPANSGFFPAWPVDTNDLNFIYGFQSGSGVGTFTDSGDFTGGGNYCNADPTILSDGMIATITSLPNLAFCGCGPTIYGVGSVITYSLNTNSAPFGIDITNITVFGGWQDAGRDEQKYQVLYSTMQNPTSFTPLVTADYVPTDNAGDPVVTRTTLVPVGQVLVHNVAALQISWNVSPAPKNGWEGYSEILAGGQASTGFVPTLTNDVTPSTASDVVGGQLILSAGFSGATSLQWQYNGTNIPGATSAMLTLNDLQLTNSGNYNLVASNAVGGNSSSVCAVTVNTNAAPVNNILTAIATQTSIANVFTPTWNTNILGSSLIAGASPSSSGEGDFTGGSFNIPTGASGPAVLTDGTYGTIDFNNTSTHSCWTCMGTGVYANENPTVLLAGQYVTYTLTGSPNGYDITNIATAGGWNDQGRDQQAYTVKYATTANPTDFIPLAVVNYNPVNPSGYSMVRATISPASGVLASNVVALQFDMTTPPGENGFSGYSEIAVFGSPSVNPPPVGPQITIQHEETNFDFVLETPNLIANQLPTANGPGAFTNEGCSEAGLTDGTLSFGGNSNSASCGTTNSGAVTWVEFNAPNGWNLTNIVVYTLWHDYGRDEQFYDVSYSTLAAPTTFLPLASLRYDPPVPHNGTNSANRVQIAPPVGQTFLATNVAAVKFDFTPDVAALGWAGLTEIVLQGTNLPAIAQPTLPTSFAPPIHSGGNLILTGSGGTPAGYSYTWLQATNLTPPITWTTNVQGVLDGSGAFSNAIPIGTNKDTFFRFRMP